MEVKYQTDSLSLNASSYYVQYYRVFDKLRFGFFRFPLHDLWLWTDSQPTSQLSSPRTLWKSLHPHGAVNIQMLLKDDSVASLAV